MNPGPRRGRATPSAPNVTTGESRLRRRELRGWPVIEIRAEPPRWRVLMLPGLFCSAEFFTDVLAAPQLRTGRVAAIAADPPGFAGVPAPDGFDFLMESYAALIEDFAAAESIDLAQHGGEVASRLATASRPVWVGRGDRDEVGLTDAERAIIDAAPHVALKRIDGAAHFSITDAPDQVAQLIVDLLAV